MNTNTPSANTIKIETLRGVGPKLAAKLAGLGIFSIYDLLFHLPLRYQDRTYITPIAACSAGMEVLIQGQLVGVQVVYGRRRSLLCQLRDDSGTLRLRFYHFTANQHSRLNQLADGNSSAVLRCYGGIRRGASGYEMYHPEYQIINDPTLDVESTLTPVYPSIDGIGQSTWRKLMPQALAMVNENNLLDYLPDRQPSLLTALRYLHLPPADADTHAILEHQHPTQQRLAFEELLAQHLSLRKLRESIRTEVAPVLNNSENLVSQFMHQLDFSFTIAQQRVCTEISNDINKPLPMLRLLQGDVGSGKTAVAAWAACHAVANDYQVAIMAPTEILAEQHFFAFDNWFAPLGIRCACLTGRNKGKARAAILDALASGETQIIIGTHALFQNDVHYHRLGLSIIDEQHRFGVQQRLSLREKAQHQQNVPHQLIMTATPIPRTLAMTAYADLDVSIIDELPPGRTPINTVLIEQSRREQVIERVKAACNEGRQCYWVCTLIEESEALQAQAAEVVADQLRQELPQLAIGLVHGRLKADEKSLVMESFVNGSCQVLVATTVIEVGVNVPNASVMIIENPERLGLAQLHQLRGRVGRGDIASHCVLLYSAPLSKQGKQRLRVMRESNDGFYIAEQDLLLRGPGEVMGTQQTGLAQLRIADVQRDVAMLPAVKTTAEQLLRENPQIIDALIERWIAGNERFANA